MNSYCRLLLLLVFFMANNLPYLQAALVPVSPTPKPVKKKRVIPKKHSSRLFSKNYKEKKKTLAQHYKKASFQDEGLGVVGIVLFILLAWWVIMAIPIALGVLFGIPALWIIGVILASLPLFLLLILIMALVFAPKREVRPTMYEEKNTPI